MCIFNQSNQETEIYIYIYSHNMKFDEERYYLPHTRAKNTARLPCYLISKNRLPIRQDNNKKKKIKNII